MLKLKEFIRLLRPHQWLKNIFILAGLVFSHAWFEQNLFYHVIVAFIAFSLLASGIYIFNDIIDRNKDQLHPHKKLRPIAAGTISIASASLLGLLLSSISLLLGFYISATLGIILLGYILLNIAYSFYLKHVVILDVFVIACGFILRMLAGTIGIMIAPSNWLILCTLMLALFLGFAKRYSELLLKQTEPALTREVLRNYSHSLLDKLMIISASGAIFSYSLYTMSPETIQTHHTNNLVYTVPLVLYGIFRYLYLLYQPKSILSHDITIEVIKDKHLLVTIIAWGILTMLIIF